MFFFDFFSTLYLSRIYQFIQLDTPRGQFNEIFEKTKLVKFVNLILMLNILREQTK